jgi:hypothetical protein
VVSHAKSADLPDAMSEFEAFYQNDDQPAALAPSPSPGPSSDDDLPI